jgi:hypothetical protein
MRKIIIFSVALFFVHHTTEVLACGGAPPVGSVKTKVAKITATKARLCFQIKMNKGRKMPKFIGYRYPHHFTSTGKGKVVKIKKHGVAYGKIRAMLFSPQFCITLTSGARHEKTWKTVKGKEIQVKGKKFSAKTVMKDFLKGFKDGYEKGDHDHVDQKKGKNGATIGAHQYQWRSRGCNEGPPVNWKLIAFKKKLKVTAKDF